MLILRRRDRAVKKNRSLGLRLEESRTAYYEIGERILLGLRIGGVVEIQGGGGKGVILESSVSNCKNKARVHTGPRNGGEETGFQIFPLSNVCPGVESKRSEEAGKRQLNVMGPATALNASDQGHTLAKIERKT